MLIYVFEEYNIVFIMSVRNVYFKSFFVISELIFVDVIVGYWMIFCSLLCFWMSSILDFCDIFDLFGIL